jgi:arginase family enzyme
VSRAAGEELCGAIERAGLRRVYLHFDVDVINPEVFQDALMHAPGGPRFGELLSCLRMVTEAFEIVGVSVVEFRGQSEDSRRLLMDMLRDAGLT